jgi:hypothetical protein
MELHLTNTKRFNFLALLKTAFRRIASIFVLWSKNTRKCSWDLQQIDTRFKQCLNYKKA